MNRLIIPTVVIITVIGIGAFFVLSRPNLQRPQSQAPLKLQLDQRAPAASTTPITTKPAMPVTPPQVMKQSVSMSERSPFGMHPAYIPIPGQRLSKKFYQEALNLGVAWHRPAMYSAWISVQPDLSIDTYNFDTLDVHYKSVPEDLNILANITIEGKVDNYRKRGSYLPKDEEGYKRFVNAVIERYDGDGKDDVDGLKNPILYWQVDNEPVDKMRKDFGKFQKLTYQVIKEACSHCIVLAGGAMQPTNIKTGNFIVDKDEYLKEFSVAYEPILRELDGEGMDVFDFHWYGTADDYRKMRPVYESLISLLEKYNFKDVPIWITEMGSYSGKITGRLGYSYPSQTETQQATDYLKRFVYPLSLGIKKVFPAFGLMEGFKNDDSYFDHTGFIYDGKGSSDLGFGIKKLSYYTYKKMTEILEGSDWNNIQTVQDKNGIYIYRFIKSGKSIWVAWNDNSVSKQITIPYSGTSQVKITEAVPKYELGKDVKDYSSAFNMDTKSASGGNISIILGDKPVFVEEK